METIVDWEQEIESLGYKKLSDMTWEEHCNTRTPDKYIHNERPASDFYDCVVFQKNLKIKGVHLAMLEIGLKNKKFPIHIPRIILTYQGEKDPSFVRRMTWDIIRNDDNFIPSIQKAEKEAIHLVDYFSKEEKIVIF